MNQAPRRKIAFVIASLAPGGAERVISNLSNGLINSFEVVIVTFENSKPFYELDERIQVIPCLESIKQPSNFYQSLKLNSTLISRLYQIIKKEQIDIVIGFITSANILSIIASKLSGVPNIICERNNPLMEDVPKFWVFLRKFMYPLADKIVLQTQGVKRIYQKKINPKKLFILPNPIATELTNSRDSNNNGKENLILTVGRLDKNKCQEDLINAFGKIKKNGWKVLLIGDGYREAELNHLIESNELSGKVEIISQVKDIHKYYNKASIFVFTSKTEGFPNALLEAMHFGLPSISTDCDFGPSDLIVEGENGFLVPVNNVDMLAEKLTLLIIDRELRNKLSCKAIVSTNNYAAEKVVSKWEELINSTLHSNLDKTDYI
ncbi:glycosyltransferase family 4 protein [Subsaxibacter sp. CAU 1640]|uniref:glycosyltransferase family 4 protein n=1 Tax=Subsaxibacter sp. CAU 1640 TaxID=2933271 RepID=UPI002004E9A9|nr:glycosyltransferase family 4 protein [Subsaxibacter sp. CAU 1640]MCK7591029.1 glycosyltransferase family 4 protein [Subsaxibacter sp. CAU 1640]